MPVRAVIEQWWSVLFKKKNLRKFRNISFFNEMNHFISDII